MGSLEMKGRFSVSHRAGAKFVRRGLRSYFEYRDLGIRRATAGRVLAHVIRARKGRAPHGEWHAHRCEVQFVYVLRGWVEFEYEGVGRVRMKPGTCFYQPPGIRHREIRHSSDLEMLEVVAPARFRTVALPAPRPLSGVEGGREAHPLRRGYRARAARAAAR
jgi:mannose-6-phosphate isomerase-like protein (cupin superfamily)